MSCNVIKKFRIKLFRNKINENVIGIYDINFDQKKIKK